MTKYITVKLTEDQYKHFVNSTAYHVSSCNNLLDNPVWVQNKREYQPHILKVIQENRAFYQRLKTTLANAKSDS